MCRIIIRNDGVGGSNPSCGTNDLAIEKWSGRYRSELRCNRETHGAGAWNAGRGSGSLWLHRGYKQRLRVEIATSKDCQAHNLKVAGCPSERRRRANLKSPPTTCPYSPWSKARGAGWLPNRNLILYSFLPGDLSEAGPWDRALPVRVTLPDR